MRCSNHDQSPANGICVACGKPFCSDCLVEVNGRNYCHRHAGEALDRPKYEQPQASPSSAQQQDGYAHQKNCCNHQPPYTQPQHGQNVYAQPPYVQPVNVYNYASSEPLRKSRVVAFILCLFMGGIGIHRFYVGKIGTGIIWFLTFGLFGLGWLIDILLIALGAFRDYSGQPLD
ncbi:MAG: NINE protein [Clostridiales bacterium]|jgi:hypothetical protein|nr:NINE protein [Clostridiales bacterium]